jgi:glycosyltransferase involved in cell wall biosynthesis
MLGDELDRPVRLAVLFDEDVEAGGGYQQALNACILAARLPSELCTPRFFVTSQHNFKALSDHDIEAQYLSLGRWARRESVVWAIIGKDARGAKLLHAIRTSSPLEKALSGIADLVYLTSPSTLALGLEQLNYLATIWDEAHREEVEFPEVRRSYTFYGRERLHRETVLRAVGTFVDSERSRTMLTQRYGITADRVHILPFSPAAHIGRATPAPSCESLKVKHRLKCDYVFYPAQFWTHKNHVYILRGLKRIEVEFGKRVGAIFSGADKGNENYVRELVDTLGLTDRVRFTNFVGDLEISELYRCSLALVMPTYFGPTNLPPLEAFALGVPVIYSDRPGFREQVGNGALLVNLNDPGTLAAAIVKIQEDTSLRNRLVEEGKRQLSQVTDETRLSTFCKVLSEFRSRRICWP